MMISRKHFVAICFTLMAGFGCIPGAFAQARPASPLPQDADHPTVAEASRATRWDTIQWVERRYKIEALRFKARVETGHNWLYWTGSDEVMVQTDDAKGWTVSREIGDIDSGDTHNFDAAKSCIVAVRPGIVVLGESSVCEEVGEPAPLGFGVEFWEQDSIGFPYDHCIGGVGTLQPGRHGGPYPASCTDGTGFGDFIGSARIDYPTHELEAALPHVGDEVIESVTLHSCPGESCAGFPNYSFTWRVTRLPDVRVDFSELLDEAMQRSGARSELEAIAAGLRSLRAPSPRKIEPQEVDPSPGR